MYYSYSFVSTSFSWGVGDGVEGLRNTGAFCVRFVYVLCTFCVRFVYVLCTFCVRFVYVLCTFRACFVYVLCTFCVRFVYVLWTFCVRFVYVLCTFCVRFMYVLCTFCVRFVYVLCTSWPTSYPWTLISTIIITVWSLIMLLNLRTNDIRCTCRYLYGLVTTLLRSIYRNIINIIWVNAPNINVIVINR